jgi:ribosome-binding factor A
MWSRRLERINELLLHEFSKFVLEKQVSDIGFVTFTGVKTTDDLMEARVFYSVLGSEEERARTAEILESLGREFRSEMRHLESLRRSPKLIFVYDETPEKAARVFEILEKLHREEEAPAEPPAKASPRKTNARRPRSPKKK